MVPAQAAQYTQWQKVQYYMTAVQYYIYWWLSSSAVHIAVVVAAASQYEWVIQFVDKYINVMAVTFAVWFVKWALAVLACLAQIEITSQVLATRSNFQEFS